MSDEDEALQNARWAAVEEATELLLEGQHQQALAQLREVLTQDPGNSYAYHYLGVACFELAEYEPARDAYLAALRHAPKYLGARVGLAEVHRKLRNFKVAVVEAERALTDFPRDGGALYTGGLALAAIGHKKAAQGYLRRFLKTEPELESQLEVRSVLEMLEQSHEGDPFELE